jgi:hypothetical protein
MGIQMKMNTRRAVEKEVRDEVWCLLNRFSHLQDFQPYTGRSWGLFNENVTLDASMTLEFAAREVRLLFVELQHHPDNAEEGAFTYTDRVRKWTLLGSPRPHPWQHRGDS